MTVAAETLPLETRVAPADQDALIAAVRDAYAAGTAIYPLGGETSLDFGLSTRQSGLGISLANLARVVDYPARDMTITVEAGITMAALIDVLAAQGQRLPIDVPMAGRATLGGVVATNTSGPRRYGRGTARDYVIGIAAVDGRGTLFHGGGRVVKNVAGYDFCKLLTGSLGTLGIITQLTLKLTPLAERSAFASCEIADFAAAELALAQLASSRTSPTVIELLVGSAWRDDAALGHIPQDAQARLLVGFEGTDAEVEWQLKQIKTEWQALPRGTCQNLQAIADGPVAIALWQRLIEFPVAELPGAAPSPMVIRVNLLPSRVASFIELLQSVDAHCSVAAHAGNGIVVAKFSDQPQSSLIAALIQRLQPAARAAGGSVIVLSAAASNELTRQVVWGPAAGDWRLMAAIKRQFDPKGLLNPGRFVY